MSIFKANKWWSDESLKSGETSEGVQNGSCIKVDKFSSHSDSDCIVIGEESLLKIYKPNKDDENVSATLLESNLNESILQVDTGKFIADLQDRQILVLHPQSYVIYQIQRREGHSDPGEQNMLRQVSKHSFSRKAHAVVCGPFGNIKTRDLICIQALDGSLSFFDQETFLFIYVFSDVIIPGPVAYVASSDVFVICKSSWVLEIYSYQQLKELGELTSRQNKKNIPQWVYNAGEEIFSLQAIQTSSNFSSIIALGERHLCCFQDNGLMKYMIKFEYMPICFCAYIIGWYYEPTARLLIMVASEDSKLYIYENTTLLWSCDLPQLPITISRCFLKYLPGGVVTMSAKGTVTISYLGTEPNLNANAVPMVNDSMDLEQVQKELEDVEDSLRKILDGDEDPRQYNVDQLVSIKADVGKPVQNLFGQFGTNDERDETLHLLMCPVVVILTCSEPSLVQSIQITYNVAPPFACSESTICLESINGTEILETQVFLANKTDISEAGVKILFTVTDSNGRICILTREVLLPLSLYCLLTDVVNESEVELIIETNHSCIDVTEIFTGKVSAVNICIQDHLLSGEGKRRDKAHTYHLRFVKWSTWISTLGVRNQTKHRTPYIFDVVSDFINDELLAKGNATEVSLTYRSTKRVVTLRAADKQYSLQANDAADITGLLRQVVAKLMDYYARMNVKDLSYSLIVQEELSKVLIHKFLKSVEAHAKERIKLKSLQDGLSILQRQFTLVQKKLLVQYGSLPPGDTDSLEFLMKDTHNRIVNTAHDIIQSRENTSKAGNSLAAVGQLLVFIFQQTVRDTFTVTLVQEMLALNSLYEEHQEWEEPVIQSLSYILNKVLRKSEKDKEKLAPVTEQGILSHINLKRFIKQLRLVLEKMFFEARSKMTEHDEDVGNRVTRIEEFVEVI